MKKSAAILVSILLLASLFVSDALACTTFCLKNKGEVLFGKNYDWMIGDGIVFVNKRGVAKFSTAQGSPAKWVSGYGSVTFNQYGRENPMGGMNEAGLVIELMWLDETKYPAKDARPALDTLEWIQYQLDTSATVEEVLKNSENVRIDSPVTLHYLVNDKNGDAATVEFLDGKLVAHTGEKLAVSALANDTYEKSWKYAAETESFGGAKATPQTESSLDRFTRAAQKTKEFAKKEKTEQEAVAYAFDVLSNVAQKQGTQWSIVYDQKRGKVYFRTRLSQSIKSVELKNFDFACGSRVKMFDINSKDAGDVTAKFADYTRAANRDLIERSFSGTDFLKGVPAKMKDFLAEYPESFNCADGKADRKPQIKQTSAAATGYFLLSELARLLMSI
jgi:penicillin V acylase-like amidase (Ntn superfamily)